MSKWTTHKKTLVLIVLSGLFAGIFVSSIYLSLRRSAFHNTEKNSVKISLGALANNIGVFVKIGDIYSLHQTVSTFINFIPAGRIQIFDASGLSLIDISKGVLKEPLVVSNPVNYTNEHVGHISLSVNPAIFSLSEIDLFFCFGIIVLFCVFSFYLALNIVERWKEHNLRLSTEVSGLRKINDMRKQVAHDIASPLSALKLTSDKLPKELNSQKKLLDSSIERINSITQDLRSSFKIHENADPERLRPVNIQEVVDSILAEKQTEYSLVKNLKITYEQNLNSSKLVRINQNQLKRIISNLLNNSVESLDPFSKNNSIKSSSFSAAASTSALCISCAFSITASGIASLIGLPPPSGK